MTQEGKELLINDLCARLPYGAKIHIDFNGIGHIVGDATLDSVKSITGQLFDFVDFEQDFKSGDCIPISGLCGNKTLHIDEFKPYLRPMSSMTEEEFGFLQKRLPYDFTRIYSNKFDLINDIHIGNSISIDDMAFLFDCLNKWHFDYRSLIPMGLALEAPEGMYK